MKKKNYGELHSEAWHYFGKDTCERCRLPMKKHLKIYGTRFHMHNTIIPKDYTVMQSYAWKYLCVKCHGEVESFARRYNANEEDTIVMYDEEEYYKF